MLAEQSVTFFNDIIPYLYQYLPDATVGNLDILKLTVMMLLPDSVNHTFIQSFSQLCHLLTSCVCL